jgi:hypothetical protein
MGGGGEGGIMTRIHTRRAALVSNPLSMRLSPAFAVFGCGPSPPCH